MASCLGHTMSLKGIFGQPRRLVTDGVRRLCSAIKMSQPPAPIKFVLMNTVGNQNRDLAEPITISLIRERAMLSNTMGKIRSYKR